MIRRSQLGMDGGKAPHAASHLLNKYDFSELTAGAKFVDFT